MIYKVINRCLVVEFYKQNAAFFGFIFLILFGFIKTTEHIALGVFFIANPSALFYLYLLWLAYGIKVILFVFPAIYKTENQFLDVFYLFSTKEKIAAAFSSAFALLLPCMVYTLFLILLAIHENHLISMVSLLVASFLFCVCLAALLLKKLNSLPQEKPMTRIRLFKSFTKPPFLYFIEHLSRNEFVLFLLSKIYVCGLVIGTSFLYGTDQYDMKLWNIGVLLAFVGNVAIVQKYVAFQYQQMQFSNNLPLSYLRRIGQISITVFLFILPEMLVTFRYLPQGYNFMDFSGILLFGFSLNILMYGLYLWRVVDLGKFMNSIFWLVVITTFLILFSVHPWILGTLYLIISMAIIHSRQYEYEHIP